jgi:4-hydroxybenzoate polyprenyltransferase
MPRFYVMIKGKRKYGERDIMRYIFFSLRPKQWVKNLFIFLPLVFGGMLFTFPENLKTVLAFIIFSLSSGVVYLINDIMDVEQDRLHPIKRLRPIASGKVKLRTAALLAFLLGLLSIAASFLLDPRFGLVVVVYFVFNILYSKFLKEIVIIDVFCISAFFLLRIVAGTITSRVEFSYWMILMVILLALFLGFNKRRQELKLSERRASRVRHVLSKYNAYFIDQMISVITSSMVVVYTLYTVDARTVAHVGSVHLLYTIPFVYYGIFRYLYLIHKVRKYGDPVYILFSDKTMLVNLALWMLVCLGVVYFKI